MWKQIVVLANSVKHDPGRCIAGREIATVGDDFGIGPWVRPVSRIGEGELYPRHFTFEDGSAPQIFDVIELFVETPDTDQTQPENWFVSDGRAWKRVHQWGTDRVIGSLVENPPALWLQPGVKTDRVTKEFLAANPPRQSLYLLQLKNATISAKGKKFRLRFTYRGVSYDLAITDPLITNITGGEPVSVVHRGLACVSIAPSFRSQYDGKEYHYKLAAMVISYD
jgi:hypothetical protein